MSHGEKICKGIVAAVLIGSMVLSAHATGIKENEEKKQELEQQKNDIQTTVDSLEARLDSLVLEMRATSQAMAKKEADIEQTETELVMAKLEEREQATRMRTRIKYMYENGNVSMLEVFLTSNNLTEFLNKAQYASLVSAYDKNMLDEYSEKVVEVQKKEADLNKAYEKLNLLQAQLSEKQNEVESLLAKETAKITKIESDISDLNQLIADAKEAERRRKEAEEAKKKQETVTITKPSAPVVSGNGYFTHPCPGLTRQSGYFGEIRYGIGDTTPHRGHDYAAPSGTPIYAAADGVVLIAGYSNSAGYWVVIDHGKGLTTKYMHMYKMPLVTSGQSVHKGQHIGGVGTTGRSTGNHLHFQVEEYGIPVTPSKYL